MLRFVFYFFWIFAVPFALAIGNVWLLTPAPGSTGESALRVFVAEQQIPAGIVLFTLFAMILWRFPVPGYAPGWLLGPNIRPE